VLVSAFPMRMNNAYWLSACRLLVACLRSDRVVFAEKLSTVGDEVEPEAAENKGVWRKR
jgi:hypothetical protein